MWKAFCNKLKNIPNRTHKRFTTEAASEQPNPSTLLVRYKHVKRIFLRTTIITKVAQVTTIIIGAGALWTHVHDFKNTPETQLAMVLEQLNNEHERAKKEGFDLLNQAFFITKRVFSGPVGIPVGAKLLGQEQVVSSLMNNASSHDKSISLNSLSWLYKMLTYQPLSTTVRSLMLAHDPKLEQITSTLAQSDYDQNNQWIIATHILLNLGNVQESINRVRLAQGIQSMISSGNPLATAAALQLYNLVPVQLDQKYQQFIDKSSNSSTLSISSDFLEEGLNYVSSASLYHTFATSGMPKATFFSNAAIAAFAAGYGKIMWFLRSRFSSEFKELVKLDSDQAKHLRKVFLRSRTIGRSLFALLLFDQLSSQLLRYTAGERLSLTSDTQIPQFLQKDYPLSSLCPFIQTSLFMLGSIYIIRKHKFVVLPLLIAGTYNHLDLISAVPPLNYTVNRINQFIDTHIDVAMNKVYQYTPKFDKNKD